MGSLPLILYRLDGWYTSWVGGILGWMGGILAWMSLGGWYTSWVGGILAGWVVY